MSEPTLFQADEIVRARRSGALFRILARWDNGSQMLYLIQKLESYEAPTWVSGDMLRKH